MPDLGDFPHRDRCAIVGIGATEFSRDSGRSDLTLATEASLAAIADAGLAPEDIDGIVRCDVDLVRHNDLVRRARARQTDLLGRGRPGRAWRPCAMVGQAVGAILSGQANTGPGVPLAERPVRDGATALARHRVEHSRSSAAAAPTTSSSIPTACSPRARSSP